ncbi:hypothetical protein [Paraburkholderia panacisoli]|uniref:hypothetical protein n=1 Tax=Paraburkholderia panacisoli TaxID=2603818 RepID=UPI00165EE8D1|nr:hypothetical protein [Paraburkholderia panacisoli]
MHNPEQTPGRHAHSDHGEQPGHSLTGHEGHGGQHAHPEPNGRHEQHGHHEHHGHHHDHHPAPHLVTVKIDNNPVEIEAGTYLVAELKKKLGVPADKVLEKVLGPGDFPPLDDNSHIHVIGGEEFLSAVRTGSSS